MREGREFGWAGLACCGCGEQGGRVRVEGPRECDSALDECKSLVPTRRVGHVLAGEGGRERVGGGTGARVWGVRVELGRQLADPVR